MDQRIRTQKVNSLSHKFQSTSSSSSSFPVSSSKALNEKSSINDSLAGSNLLNRRKPSEEVKKSSKSTWVAKSNLSNKKNDTEKDKGDITKPINSSKTPFKSTENNLDTIKRRLNALKVLQMRTASLESELYEEIYLLECKYNAKCKPLQKLRNKIVNGEHEPTDEECNLMPKMEMDKKGDALKSKKTSELESEREVNRDLIAMSILNYSSNNNNGEQLVKGIPEFWFNALKKETLVGEIIEVYDEPVLKYLTDIECQMRDTKPYSFKLCFHFASNEYFSNSMLSKTYEFKVEIDSNDPYAYEAPEIVASKGCAIDWRSEEKNVTKVQSGANRESFFHFFDTSDFESKDKSQLSLDDNAELALDYEFGYIFKEKIIPKAVLHYMNEIVEIPDEIYELGSESEENNSEN